jgi:uncharacterized protein
MDPRMSNSLRDQLLQLGFKTPPPPEPKSRSGAGGPANARPGSRGRDADAATRGRDGAAPRGRDNAPARGREGRRDGHAQPAGPAAAQAPRGGPPRPAKPRRSQQEIDLGKAYALRAQKEKEERIAAEQAKQEAARIRREARARLTEHVRGKTLNDAAAEIARHFEYGGKIKRIYVTAEQLRALNAGELGVLQLDGRYQLVSAAVLAEAEAIFPDAIALKVDPNAPAGDDPYADPQYRVPDDLVW